MDNPHTKPVWFWEWLIAKVNKKHPDVVFLAEAFTRPAMMHALGRAGFQQSYTYFTWRNTKEELRGVLQRGQPRVRGLLPAELLRQHPGHPHAYLQFGGPAAFKIRAALAATAARSGASTPASNSTSTWPGPGAEEYIDNEKFEYKARDWDAPGGGRPGAPLAPYLTRLNAIRRAHPALGTCRT